MGDSVKSWNEREENSKRAFYNDTTYTSSEDKLVEKVKDKFTERSLTGIEKYGTTLERNDLNLLEWLTHLQEELMDATLYIEKLKSLAKENS